MAAWASLSGYLYFKPGGGALSRLKARKRQWCVLDESRGQLVYHRTEEEARCKPPLGSIELRGAAISLDLDNQNQFVIIVDNKEIFLTAENHESMMIWLMALQAKRDHFAKYEPSDSANNNNNNGNGAMTAFTSITDNAGLPGRRTTLGVFGEEEVRERSSSDVAVREGGHKALCATKSLQPDAYPPFGANGNFSASDNISAQMRRLQLSRLGETFDSGHSSYTETPLGGPLPFSRKLSVSMEGTELLHRQSYGVASPGKYSNSHGTDINFLSRSLQGASSRPPPGETSSESTAESDDVPLDDVPKAKARHSSGHTTASRGSSLSASTDSAIDRGDNGEMAARIQELEKELISSKCELAKVLNRQTCFQDILKQKDEIILDLDDRLGKMNGQDTGYDSKKRSNQASKELQERVRILQNQNRFLNEEVRRLARLRSQQQTRIGDQDNCVQSLEARVELWKLQYVSLIQSSIRFTGTDTMDDAELSLYGGDRHKNKIRSLLEEARKVNPSLPTFENLSAGEVHVDVYGFKHQFSDCGLLLHYLCQELTQHYLTQAATYERHQQDWLGYIRTNAKALMKNRKELKELCRLGIPDQHRRQMWRAFIQDSVTDLMAEKGPHYYRSLCSMLPDSPLAARYRKQISLDLMRTMPSNIRFSTTGSKGIMDLQDVLLAFCIHNPNVGYCQGMNFLVAMALLFMDAQDAFWTLVAVTERYHTASYFDHNLLGAQADQSVLRDLLADLLPDMARHLAAIDIEISTVTLNWFLAIFFDAVPFQTLLRIWDCFLLEGPKVLFRFSLAILKMHEKEIVQKSETISVMRHLKACARVTYDVDGLVQLAFKGFRPFPRRQDISSKQTVYLKALKEKYRWRELQKLAFAERENLFLSLESETGTDSLTFECCTVTTADEVWVCYGNQSQCKVCVVDCKEGTMTDLPIQFPCRVMAACALPDAILFGTLSWNVICYRTKDRGQAWEQQVHDAVLSLCQYQDSSTTRVFAGLADGTVAVFEDVSTSATFYDVMYIMIGQSPVTCLRLVDRQLWCACGNTVSIIHAGTLDAMDSFSVSSNPYDHILSLEPGLPGVWVSVRGSSILELWDPAKLCCKMLYDTRAGRYPNLRKDDEVYFNRARITCILPLDYSVWVGTGEGSLITYEVFSHQGSKTPSDSSSFVGSYSEGFSALATQEDSGNMALPEGFDPVREAAMRVRSLYLCQSDDDINKNNHTTSSTSGSSQVYSSEAVAHTNKTHNSNGTCSTRNGHSSAKLVEPAGSEANKSRSCESAVPLLPEGAEEKRLSVDTSTTESLTPRNDTLSPECLSAVEDSEGITPTASFCVSEHSAFATLTAPQDKQSDPAFSTKKSEIKAQDGTYLVTNEKDINANVDKMVTSLTDEKDNVDSKNNSENFVCVNEINNRVSHLTKTLAQNSQEVVEIQREEDVEILRLKSASPKNGMKHTFYLGEITALSEMGDGPRLTGEGCDNTTKTRESVNSVLNSVNDVNTNSDSSEKVDRKVVASNEYNQQDLGEVNISVACSSCEEQIQEESQQQTSDICAKQKRKLYRQQTSESSIPEEVEDDEDDMASSDNSVIMQIWDALKKSRKNTHESFQSCKESQSQSNDSQSPPYSPSQDPQQGSHDLGAGCDLNNFKSYSMGSSQESQPGGDVVGASCALKNLNSHSMGSSITSQHSGSDEVFQDVADDGSLNNNTQSTATDTTVEEHQPDTVEADSMTNTGSSQSLRDTDNSCASSDEGHKHTARKRPQSLFANRGSHRSHKKSTGNVDKLDKSHRSLASTSAIPFIPAVSSVKRDSTSSITTTNSVDIIDNLQPADPEAQYRLDYTNCHVDTDVDEASLGSRRGSSFSGEGQDGLESRLKVSGWKDYDDGSESGDVGLRMLDCDPSSFIFPQDVYNLQDPNAAVGRAMLDGSVGVASLSQLLKTPALSMLSCRSWSSYDEVSTPSSLPMGPSSRGGRGQGIMGHLPHTNSQLSMATSVASVASTMELLYAADMTLMSKNKISDKPVKCLLMYMHEGKPLVLSFSGCHDDDEAVLRWTREKDEMLWTNQPILDYNPATKVTTLPSYMKARLSSSSSSKSLTQRLSNSSQ